MGLKQYMRGVIRTLSGRPGLLAGYSALLVLAACAIALGVFFFNLRGAEQTMVPPVVGKDIIEALLEMQQKELYPRIQLRFSQTAADKNKVLEQEPRPGTIVKAGRRIRLVVSQGVQISRVENYVGRMFEEVRAETRTYNSGSETPLVSIEDPPRYESSVKPAGVILEQNPAPGTGISGPVTVRFVISRGEEAETGMPALLGLSAADALDEIKKAGIQARFSIRNAGARQTPETVVSQNPASGVPLTQGRVVEVVIAAPPEHALAPGEVYKLFSRELAPSPFPLKVTLEALPPRGPRVTLADIEHTGGLFSFPYRLPAGSVLVLSLLGAEIYRETVN